MNHILHNKLEALKELCRRYKVKSLYAFGSVNTPRFTEKSDILHGYIVPEYEVLHTQSREYIVNDLLDVMKERGVEV